ncbi:MAG TPA: carbohydrate porin [Candidatus Acidoferrales bacterium]|nr:carbohydrate porin [Candidatus Acidoferrales bacterium]
MAKKTFSLLAYLILVCLLILGGERTRAQTSSAAGTQQTQDQVSLNPPQQIETDSGAAASGDPDSDALTIFPHLDSTRYWLSGQANIILQWHPAFPAKYSGPNSLSAAAQSSTSHVFTVYTGYELSDTTQVFADAEDSTGPGIGDALGLAGYTNLDVVRTADGVVLTHAPYLARLLLRQIIPLSHEKVSAERNFLNLATSLPKRRLEFWVGKFTMPDFFDTNGPGSDSHLQFLNWTVDNNGAYDYAANTRGYTDGAMVEYDDGRWSARFAEALMPKVANGINLDADVARSRSENFEADYNGGFLHHRDGAIRILAYLNHADMGNYREAIEEFLAGDTSKPTITATRRQGRHKYGFGLNFEQNLTGQLRAFGRWGWSDGHNESFVYTEVDRTLELGADNSGDSWRRKNDRAGFAFSLNGISGDHARYLALGGDGFLLGDGSLNYAHEKIVETYYTAHIWRGTFVSFDLQHINNPGYNQDRGPVLVPGVRAHVDF